MAATPRIKSIKKRLYIQTMNLARISVPSFSLSVTVQVSKHRICETNSLLLLWFTFKLPSDSTTELKVNILPPEVYTSTAQFCNRNLRENTAFIASKGHLPCRQSIYIKTWGGRTQISLNESNSIFFRISELWRSSNYSESVYHCILQLISILRTKNGMLFKSYNVITIKLSVEVQEHVI